MIRKTRAPSMISHRGVEVDRLFYEPGAVWSVAVVRSKAELVLADALATLRVSYYLPYEPVRVRSGHRYHESVRPLLSGFIFFLAQPDEFHVVKERREVARIIPAKDQVLLVTDLVRFHAVRAAAKFQRLESLQRLKAGDAVRIRDGYPAAGVEGVVDRRDATKIYLRVGMLGAASFSVEDPNCLELI